jgi:arabinogalactan oligomer / maltooligosaccharide transport system permease protein
MSRRSPVRESEARSSLSRPTQVILSYFALLLFTLFALSFSLAVIPGKVSLANFRALIGDGTFLRGLGNSALVALVVSITGVALASTVGYALSRVRAIRRSAAVPGLVAPQMLPAALVLLPLFLLLLKLGLINSYVCVLIIYALTALPFCIWQMKRCYESISIALEEAAVLDGCTRWQLFYLIILPLAAPALVITALFSFLAAWNESVVAAIVLQDVEKYILPLGLKTSQFNMSTQWGLYSASALLVSLPVLILFFVLSQFLVSGLNFGGEEHYGVERVRDSRAA